MRFSKGTIERQVMLYKIAILKHYGGMIIYNIAPLSAKETCRRGHGFLVARTLPRGGGGA